MSILTPLYSGAASVIERRKPPWHSSSQILADSEQASLALASDPGLFRSYVQQKSMSYLHTLRSERIQKKLQQSLERQGRRLPATEEDVMRDV
jgi:hypothetical protein